MAKNKNKKTRPLGDPRARVMEDAPELVSDPASPEQGAFEPSWRIKPKKKKMSDLRTLLKQIY